MSWRFTAPPGWPEPPPGWVPPPGWTPDPSWPAAPEGWQFWVQDPESRASGSVPGDDGPVAGMPAEQRARRGGWGWVVLVVVVLLIGLAAAAAAVSLLSWTMGSSQTQELRTETPTGNVRVEADCGSITLLEGAPGVVTTQATIRSTWREPKVTSRLESDVVQVTVDCPALSLGSSVSLTVEVPPEGVVEAHSSAGSVTAQGLSSDLTLSSSAGAVSATEVSSSRVSADSSAGSVSLSWAASADPTTISATSSAGSVRVSVPDDAAVAWRVDADSSAGSTTVEVRTDPQSDRTITARSSAGSVAVGYR